MTKCHLNAPLIQAGGYRLCEARRLFIFFYRTFRIHIIHAFAAEIIIVLGVVFIVVILQENAIIFIFETIGMSIFYFGKDKVDSLFAVFEL